MSHDRRRSPVVLSRIYTRTGDDGTTSLGDGSRADKTDPRLAAYADVDEANCAIGAAVTMGGLPAEITSLLVRLQNELFDVGADLCNPCRAADEPPARSPLRIDEEYVTRLEQACDAYNEGLPVLRSFVLPGGSPGAAAAAHGQDRGQAGRAQRLGGRRGARRHREPAAGQVPEPALRPAVHPGPPGQRARRRPAVATGRAALSRAWAQLKAGRRIAGGAASSQARNPVSASSLSASSIRRSAPSPMSHSTTTAPGPRLVYLHRIGRPTRYHAERVPGEDLARAQPEPEDRVPAQLVGLVSGEAEPPAPVHGEPQGALDAAAAALDQGPADRDAGGSRQRDHQDDDEEPASVQRQPPPCQPRPSPRRLWSGAVGGFAGGSEQRPEVPDVRGLLVPLG